jgi:hypothetical protein
MYWVAEDSWNCSDLSVPFAVLVAWWEQKDHVNDSFIFLIDLFIFCY